LPVEEKVVKPAWDYSTDGSCEWFNGMILTVKALQATELAKATDNDSSCKTFGTYWAWTDEYLTAEVMSGGNWDAAQMLKIQTFVTVEFDKYSTLAKVMYRQFFLQYAKEKTDKNEARTTEWAELTEMYTDSPEDWELWRNYQRFYQFKAWSTTFCEDVTNLHKADEYTAAELVERIPELLGEKIEQMVIDDEDQQYWKGHDVFEPQG
jgi:hypothetical protein